MTLSTQLRLSSLVESWKTSRQRAGHRLFTGDIRGMGWTPHAFFARSGRRMSRLMLKVRSMGRNLDFFSLQETHSTPERAIAIEDELEQHAVFWSHCSLQ